MPYNNQEQLQKGEAISGTQEQKIAELETQIEREQHKGMVIGDKGERLKRIGTEARTELERLLGRKVFLEIWVKVRSGWADDDARLRTYGYE